MHPEGLVGIDKEEFDAVSEDKLIPKGSKLKSELWRTLEFVFVNFNFAWNCQFY